MANLIGLQWISEVLHFCPGLPIILVGCKKDLRYDQKTLEELHKTSQKPVTPEQVRNVYQIHPHYSQHSRSMSSFYHRPEQKLRCGRPLVLELRYLHLLRRARRSDERLAQPSTSNAQPRPTTVCGRCSSTPRALHCCPRRARPTRRANVSSCKSAWHRVSSSVSSERKDKSCRSLT